MTVPEEVYATLKDRILSDFDGNTERTAVFESEREIPEWYAEVSVRVSTRYEDESFSHFFGTETKGHWETDAIEEVYDAEIYYCPDDGNELEIALEEDRLINADLEKSIDRKRYRRYIEANISELVNSMGN